MTNKIFTCFGLTVVALSLFASTAFAANNPGPGTTPVVVTNTPAQPVPVVVQKTTLFQATQTFNCASFNTLYTFNVPAGKTLTVRNVNVLAGSYTPGDTFGFTMYGDDGSSSFLAFGMQPVGGRFNSWANTWFLNQQVQFTAQQVVSGAISRDSQNFAPSCSGNITISGELQ